ncbi:NADP(H)-dependent aldo-keto reductase [Flavobacterium tegetincola]|uniref:NADP(H)-dependent aldo-keto reductase n=1 Tax=Flavobacterium tegetincola TaxID=150172 RepID=UPI000411C5CA|nr:NADP(H)-dependent aldo-keto reductase [Flavobacterium tegetincola]
MKYNFLPHTETQVSEIALGTMTFGQQNTESEGHDQLDFALDSGINFIDTAEMYSVPSMKETSGSTEKIIGSWLKKSGKRDQIVLATKIAGPNRGLEFIRDDLRFNAETIRLSIEKSLQRLQTDYIDLYQLHWPERKTNYFGQRSFVQEEDVWEDNIQHVLEVLQQLIKEGKIKHIGLSNETPWGIMRFLEESKKHNLPRVSTIQNPYSLLNRSFEQSLAEISHYENVGLLAYSPLAFGVLTGKFLTGESLPNARINLFPRFSRYNSENATKATILYAQIAKDNGLTLTQMALAFIRQQFFTTSTIIGATNLKQLQENIQTSQMVLTQSAIDAINQVQDVFPNPSP